MNKRKETFKNPPKTHLYKIVIYLKTTNAKVVKVFNINKSNFTWFTSNAAGVMLSMEFLITT